jgi:light-regulated signal transduction histidine kinase (bacteriophytochrome)
MDDSQSTASTQPVGDQLTELAPLAPALPSSWPLRVALAYLVFGILWIFFSDRAQFWLGIDVASALRFQTAKGWLFVMGSAVLIFVLLSVVQRRNQAVLAALLESRNEVSRINAELEQRVIERTHQLEAANRELEAFAYAVSHDLRAPLRSLSGFSQILRETMPPGLDDKSLHYLSRIHDASLKMSGLIEDLLSLSRVSRTALTPTSVDLTQLWEDAAVVIRERYPGREVSLTVQPNLTVMGDLRLLRIALENLLDNAWKYSSVRTLAQITIGAEQRDGQCVYFIRDNGIGFDMAYANKLFWPFQRLHTESQFPGTGIGLVTVQRIVIMHGGRIWADAAPDRGATFFFTVGVHGTLA